MEGRKGKLWKGGVWGHEVALGRGGHRGLSVGAGTLGSIWGAAGGPGEHWRPKECCGIGGDSHRRFLSRGAAGRRLDLVRRNREGARDGRRLPREPSRWGRGTGGRLFWRRHWAGYWLSLVPECEETLSFRSCFKVPVCGLETGKGFPQRCGLGHVTL